MLDAMRMRTACFARAPQRYTSRRSKHFLLTFQEVTPPSKTRNQLYLTIMGGTLELLLEALQAYPDPQIPAWLGGLLHVTDLMTHTVSRLVPPTPLETKHLQFARVELPISVRRG